VKGVPQISKNEVY